MNEAKKLPANSHRPQKKGCILTSMYRRNKREAKIKKPLGEMTENPKWNEMVKIKREHSD